jgi:hypothetical protein
MLSSQTEALLIEVLQACPPGSASVRKLRDRNQIRLLVEPSTAAAAKIEIDVTDGDSLVDVFIGHDTHLELDVRPDAWRATGLSFADELRFICAAVMRGQFEETLWLHGEAVVRSEAAIGVGPSSLTASATHPGGDVSAADVRTLSYDPYC